MRIAVAAGTVLLLGLVAVLSALNARDLPPEELARRCDACRPAWNGYQEDIKEIGARPVASWHGEPVAVSVLAGEVRVTMALAPPWDGYPAALPLLLKNPEGQVYRHTRALSDGSHRIYIFDDVSGMAVGTPPWLELQYPHTRRRIHLDAAGGWMAGAAAGRTKAKYRLDNLGRNC